MIASIAAAFLMSNSVNVDPPMPYGVLPNKGQLAWHEMEFYGFAHFTTNTFTDKEWGFGDESPEIFNPTEFDAEQIVSILKDAGMKGVIVTCKHHDGFCLWPSKYTEHDVSSSPYKDGKGDIIREFADACEKYDMKFGAYLSPWDRNHPDYGTQKYITYFRNQMEELLTEYGEIFEFWFDGANGGDGYYGGANESRKIDRATYYDWPTTWKMLNDIQPDTVIFSDIGPGCRWIGNESGHAGDPCWATYTPQPLPGNDTFGPGYVEHTLGHNGTRNGKYWIPGEVDVSIRPGWFYHASQDDKVRTPENIIDMYFGSVGQGASFLLNVPPDRRGLIHENDEASLRATGAILRATFGKNLADGAFAEASNTRGDGFGPDNLLDDSRDTYWATNDAITEPSVTLNLDGEKTFNVISLREHLPLGQRIDDWALDAWFDGAWKEIGKGTAIGSRRLWRGNYITTDRVRLRITKSPVCPAISEFAVYAEPAKVDIVPHAKVFIDSTTVELKSPKPGVEIRYTLDGSEPTARSRKYSAPFKVSETTSIRAVSIDSGVVSPRQSAMEITGYSGSSLRSPIVFIRKPDEGLRYEAFEGGWQSLDQMADRKAIKTGTCDVIDIKHRTRDEHAALAFSGFISVPEDGIYVFTTSSDDGSRLRIGKELVVENDGLHGMGEVEGSIGLKAGWHPFRVEWFNATGGIGLEVTWQGPGINKQAISKNRLGR
jgi:alpha-L-fucosidase